MQLLQGDIITLITGELVPVYKTGEKFHASKMQGTYQSCRLKITSISSNK